MRDDLYKLISEHGTSRLTDEQRAAIKADIESDSAELMRLCAERKAERLGDKWQHKGVRNDAKYAEWHRNRRKS